MAGEIKRVLWISDFFPRPHDPTTGVWALESAVAIQQRGVEVVVLSPTPWIPAWMAVTKGLRPWSVVPRETRIKDIPIFYAKCLHYPDRRVIRWLYNPIPVLESHIVWSGCRETVRHIMDRYPFQAIHANFVFPAGFIGLQIKKMYGVPLVIHERSQQRLSAAQRHRYRRKMYTEILKEADAVITPNSEMARDIREMTAGHLEVGIVRDVGAVTGQGGFRSQGPQVGVLRSASDASMQNRHSRRRPDQYEGKKVILSVGSFIERKGREILIRAVGRIRQEFPEVRCVIIGGGPRKPALERITRELSLGDIVEFLGKRPHQEVLDAMSWCDVFALPSWDEPFGTVYAEAMAFEKPVVACAGQGISEIVKDGVQGLLVRPGDIGSLADAFRSILGNPERARRLGRAGRELVDAELNYGALSSQLIQIYRQIQPGPAEPAAKGKS